MFIVKALKALKARFSSTVGAVSQEYVFTTIVSAMIVGLLVKLIQSDLFMGLVQDVVSAMFTALPRLLMLAA